MGTSSQQNRILPQILNLLIFLLLRLTIPYAFVILWSGHYFENAGGPMFRHIYEREQLSCRKNWWINLLYLNNHVNKNERVCVCQRYLSLLLEQVTK